MIPQLPTDSLYKFLALAGLVLCGFCLWYPKSLNPEVLAEQNKAKDELHQFLNSYEEMLNAFVNDNKLNSNEHLLVFRVALWNPNTRQLEPTTPGTPYIDYAPDSYRQYMKWFDITLLDIIQKYKWQAAGAKPKTKGQYEDINQLPGNSDSGDELVRKELFAIYASFMANRNTISPEVFALAKTARNKLQEHSPTVENLWQISETMKYWQQVGKYGLTCGIVISAAGFSLWYLRSQKYHDTLLRSQAKPEKQNSKQIQKCKR